MGNTEQLSITAREYDALEDLRGLKEGAHYLVMTTHKTNDGEYILQGSPKAFDELISDLSDEIFCELSPPRRLAQLRKLYRRISPDGDF